MTSSTSLKVSNFKLNLSLEDKAFILERISDVLSSHRWALGSMGRAFEDAFKNYTGAAHVISVSNGGVSLIALLRALKVPEGSCVICPTLTAPPTPHAILESNMKVVFADSNPKTLGLDPEDVRRKMKQFGSKVGAVITVHVGGWIDPSIRDLFALCQSAGIPLIEDCAHAHGSWFGGKHAGATSGLASYSFFMTKPLTCGEGGAVTVEDAALAEAISVMRSYGKNADGVHIMQGFNYKMSEFDAVVAYWAALNAQRLADERRAIAARYDGMLENTPKLHIVGFPECKASYYKYAVTVDPGVRDILKKRLLLDFGVEPAGGIYDTLCHEEPYFRSIPDRVLNASETFLGAESFSRRQLCLPLYPGLSLADQDWVGQSLKKIVAEIKSS